jgi:uncharacterized protein (DUF2249 family)
MESKPIISPALKVGVFLEAYPELEPVLLNLAPAFKKLQNPVLRRTIGRIATLQQVAITGNIPVEILINKLRTSAGHLELLEKNETVAGIEGQPMWLNSRKIVKHIDARPILNAGEHPMELVFRELQDIHDGEILELITPFIPAPLIEKVKSKGYMAYTIQESDEVVKTYFMPEVA